MGTQFTVGPKYGPMRAPEGGIFPSLPKPPQVSDMSREDLAMAPKHLRDATQSSPFVRRSKKGKGRKKRAGGVKNLVKSGRIRGW